MARVKAGHPSPSKRRHTGEGRGGPSTVTSSTMFPLLHRPAAR